MMPPHRPQIWSKLRECEAANGKDIRGKQKKMKKCRKECIEAPACKGIAGHEVANEESSKTFRKTLRKL